jgi:hypothetical protein
MEECESDGQIENLRLRSDRGRNSVGQLKPEARLEIVLRQN